jgi:transposase-like protein
MGNDFRTVPLCRKEVEVCSVTVPDRTECPRCHKVGFVRYEKVIHAGHAERHYYCGSCNHSWIVNDDGTNHGHRAERSPGD